MTRSLKAALRDSRSPLVRALYRAARAPYAHWILHRRRAAQAPYLTLRQAEIDRAVTLSVQYLLRQGQGDIAEFGVRTGIYARIECRELAAWQANRRIHLFDSWEGYPDATEDDRRAWEVRAGRFAGQTSEQIAPQILKARLARLYDRDRIIIHKGFFADTLPKLVDVRFGLIVMDADLFSSSYTVFEHLFGRGLVSDGVMILFCSWNNARARQDAGVQGAWQRAVADFAINWSLIEHFALPSMRAIVHSYRATP
jgi:hypothetical protein